MNPYPGYYSVFDPTGKKIADCGALRDATNLVFSRNKNWEGHYYQFTPMMGQIVDVTQYEHIQLPTKDIVVNMDGGVGCLLYTSPSPRDATLSRMPSSA